ncbi:exodeoxyribonuclease VII small subunit XseB [methanogenic archaeon ISO4-H5]|jgi:exodeoxyribonuclease VII small subunit|nr:exodeoxyribonuclease VII small subunit XseB [methanogenic archaeon ISO4-H5]MBO5518696.1 exodeoxyribonuclease VII small subunit [Methanomethylophilus sp.]MEE3363957.1 exodeoxyribonuclease VII small subunit [Methanomethylophilus sp.]
MSDAETGKLDVEKLSFEESMSMLEELVKKLEGGNLDLDESLKVYENAVALREHCRKILDESDRKVQAIMETASGTKKEDFTELE